MEKGKGLPKENLEWRRKQKRGAIMKPETFKKIKEQQMARGLSEERAQKIAGKAYWETEKKKYKESKKHEQKS